MSTLNFKVYSTNQPYYRALFRLWFLCVLSLSISSCAVQPNRAVPAFLPTAAHVPPSTPSDIDGIWRISTIGKNIRIQRGRAIAIDSWLHLFTLKIEPGMVVIKNIAKDGNGGYRGDDLPLLGKWYAKRSANGALDVRVAGAFGPVYYQLLPISQDNYYEDVATDYDDGDDSNYYKSGDDNKQPLPPPYSTPIKTIGNTLTEIGKNCYEDFKPMTSAMLKYRACQAGMGNFNALKTALKAKDINDAKAVFNAARCRNEFNHLINTVRRKGFKSISLGLSGGVSAIIGGEGEAFVATNLDLSQPTIYGSLGVSLGTQVGAGADGVISVYLSRADQLSGKGKSFSVSLKAVAGAGGAVGLSSGRSPRCESFSASAGVGAAANVGSISTTHTFKLIRIPKPDFSPSCNNVSVSVLNRTSTEVKIIDVDFYDYKRKGWRSKVIKNRVIPKGKSWSKKLRLQKVKGDKTKVKIQYRAKIGRGLFKKWSTVKSKVTRAKICNPGISFSTELF